jgi:hypothetical protein
MPNYNGSAGDEPSPKTSPVFPKNSDLAQQSCSSEVFYGLSDARTGFIHHERLRLRLDSKSLPLLKKYFNLWHEKLLLDSKSLPLLKKYFNLWHEKLLQADFQ